MDHHPLAPSGADTWGLCSGSTKLILGLPPEETTEALEGTATHAICHQSVEQNIDPANFIGKRVENWLVSEEQVERARVYIEYVRGLLPMTSYYALETRLDLSAYYDGEYGPWFGTTDFCAVIGTKILVVDYKDGYVAKDPAKVRQLKIYALGLYERVKFIYRIETVELVVIQPKQRVSIKTHTMTIEELRAFGEEIKKAADNVDTSPTLFTPGHEQCEFCRARELCAYRAGNVLAAVAGKIDSVPLDARPEMREIATISPEQWSVLLPQLPAIVKWCNRAIAYATRQTEQGWLHIPGYALDRGALGHSKWKDPAAAEAFMRSLRWKKSEMYEQSLVSPTQARKVAKLRRLSEEKLQELEELIFRPQGSVKLVQEGMLVKGAETIDSYFEVYDE